MIMIFSLALAFLGMKVYICVCILIISSDFDTILFGLYHLLFCSADSIFVLVDTCNYMYRYFVFNMLTIIHCCPENLQMQSLSTLMHIQHTPSTQKSMISLSLYHPTFNQPIRNVIFTQYLHLRSIGLNHTHAQSMYSTSNRRYPMNQKRSRLSNHLTTPQLLQSQCRRTSLPSLANALLAPTAKLKQASEKSKIPRSSTECISCS
jgi:hypothetical protein